MCRLHFWISAGQRLLKPVICEEKLTLKQIAESERWAEGQKLYIYIDIDIYIYVYIDIDIDI